jgi:hypothetical protein
MIRYGKLSKRRADGSKERIVSSKSGVKSKPMEVAGPNNSLLARVAGREERFNRSPRTTSPDMVDELLREGERSSSKMFAKLTVVKNEEISRIPWII